MLSVGDEVKAITYGDLTDASDMQGGQLISLGTNCIPGIFNSLEVFLLIGSCT